MWLIHHVSENLILNQGCSQKYNNNENIHVDNLEVFLVNGITISNEDEYNLGPTAE